MIPGEILPGAKSVRLHADGEPRQLTLTNGGDVPVHLTAHFHLMEANKRLCFDRRAAFGMRLHIHAKGSVRIEPGETVTVEIVPIGGLRRVFGFNNAIDGPLDGIDPDKTVQQLVDRGFCHRPGDPQ
ncbi:MAG: urease subunit beta [Thermomicrobiales bacterium]